MGFSRTHNPYFHSVRQHQDNQMHIKLQSLLGRINLLTTTNEHIPPNKNTKERRSIKFRFYFL